MNPNELRSLQEAYLEVVDGQQLDEAEYAKFNDGRKSRVTRIGGEFKKPKPLTPLPKSSRKSTDGVEKLEKGREAFNKSRERASRNMLRQTNEEVSVYDIVLSHLIDEGYADTVESAEGIMVNMSEEWRDSIVLDEAFKQFPEKKVSRKIQREKDRLTGGVDRSDKTSGSQVQGRQDELNRKRVGRIMKMSNTMNDKTFTSPKERSKMNARAQKTVRTVDRIKDRQVGGNTSKDKSRSYGLEPRLKDKKK